MRYYEIATADTVQELDEDLKSKLKKLANLGAAAGTAACSGNDGSRFCTGGDRLVLRGKPAAGCAAAFDQELYRDAIAFRHGKNGARTRRCA